MIYRLRPTLAFLLLSIPSLNAHCYEEFAEDLGGSDLITSPTGEMRKISTLPVIASVITKQDIIKYGYTSLAEILNTVPGLFMGTAPLAHEPVYSVRGFISNGGVLFLIDGLPLNELIFGDNDISIGRIPIASIERVEVTRGPGSNLFGGEAFTSVINIVTSTNIQSNKVSISKGSFNTKHAAIQLTRELNRGSAFSLSADIFETDGYESSISADFQTQIDDFLNTSASLAPGHANLHRKEASTLATYTSGKNKLTFRTFHWRDKELGLGVAGAIDPVGTINLDGIETGYNKIVPLTNGDSVNLKAKYTFINHHLDSLQLLPPGTISGLFPDGVLLDINHDQQALFAQLSREYNGIENHQIEIGIGFEYNLATLNSASGNYSINENTGLLLPLAGGNTAFFSADDRRDRESIFIYAEDEWALSDDLYLTFGARVDDYSDHETVYSPRLALVWAYDYDLTYKLIYGRGYRVPTFLETDVVGVPGIVRNPNLVPEKLDSIDLGFDYKHSQTFTLVGNAFYHRTQDQITQTDSGFLGVFPENIGEQRGRGVEVELDWSVSRSSELSFFYAYQENRIFPSAEDAGYSPHNKYRIGYSTRYRGLTFSANAIYISDRDRSPRDTKPPAKNFGFIDTNIIYEYSDSLTLNLKILNLTDADNFDAAVVASYPSDVQLPGRSLYFSLEALF